jgi:hypothetical protein
MCLGNTKFAIRAVRNDRLARLKVELRAIELHGNYVWFKRHQAGDTANFRVGLTIRPCHQTCVTDIVVAA